MQLFMQLSTLLPTRYIVAHSADGPGCYHHNPPCTTASAAALGPSPAQGALSAENTLPDAAPSVL